MAKGLYIRADGAVMVEYGARKIVVPKAQYKANGYQPKIERLPLEAALNLVSGKLGAIGHLTALTSP